MKFIMILCLCAGVMSVTPNAHAVKLGTRIKAAFGNKDAKVEVKQHRADKHAKKAEKACAKGKHRKCERHKRKAASNQYAADTGDFKGARQMKRRDRKFRRAKKACRKGKRKKCDRLSRNAEFKNCLLNGGSRKECRIARRQARKDQRGFRKGFTDVNTTRGIMSGLNHQQNADRDEYAVGNDLGEEPLVGFPPPSNLAFQLTDLGCRTKRIDPAYIDGISYFNSKMDCSLAHGQLMASQCSNTGGRWNGQFCMQAQPQGGSGYNPGYSKTSRFIPLATRAPASTGSRQVIKGSVNGASATRTINTFGSSVNNAGSQAVGGSLNP